VQQRLRRLLVLLPWLMAREETPVAEAARRFHVSERELVADLEIVAMCGLPPYVDELIDLYVDDGVIHVGIPRVFTRPFRLTADEGFRVLAACQAALQLPGADPHGPLARAVSKLAAALGEPEVAVVVERPVHLDEVERAVIDHERMAVSYYTASRDELTERTIDPLAVFFDRGNWYVVADDSASGQERRFRIDRIEACRPTGETFAARDVALPLDGWFDAGVPVATVRLPAAAAWVVETYPVASSERLDDGSLLVRLPVAGQAWLERLLLRAGPEAAVLEPDELKGVGRAAAARVLDRYAER
jgi:proteasome accessory factor C